MPKTWAWARRPTAVARRRVERPPANREVLGRCGLGQGRGACEQRPLDVSPSPRCSEERGWTEEALPSFPPLRWCLSVPCSRSGLPFPPWPWPWPCVAPPPTHVRGGATSARAPLSFRAGVDVPYHPPVGISGNTPPRENGPRVGTHARFPNTREDEGRPGPGSHTEQPGLCLPPQQTDARGFPKAAAPATWKGGVGPSSAYPNSVVSARVSLLADEQDCDFSWHAPPPPPPPPPPESS